MADDFDAVSLMIAIDLVEERGMPDEAERLRELVRAETWRQFREWTGPTSTHDGPGPAESIMPLCLDIESHREELERQIRTLGYGLIDLRRSQTVLRPGR